MPDVLRRARGSGVRLTLPACLFLAAQLACSDSLPSPSASTPIQGTVTSADAPPEMIVAPCAGSTVTPPALVLSARGWTACSDSGALYGQRLDVQAAQTCS